MPSPKETPSAKHSGPKSLRVLLYAAAVILTFLLLWLWSFLLSDIGAVTRPAWDEVESSIVDEAMENRLEDLDAQSAGVSQKIADLEQSQKLLRDSTNSTRDTMNQLLENQKSLADKNIALSPAEQDAIAQSQKLFLDNQTKYQDLNQELVEQTAEKRRLAEESSNLREELGPYYEKAQERYRELLEKAEMKSAVVQLTLLLPLFLLALWLIVKKRRTTYGILIYPLGISLFLKMMLVVHAYFPSRYFKYLALLGLIAAVVTLMMYLLRMMVRPNPDLVLKRNREAYNSHVCAKCSFPIQKGWLHRAGLAGKRAPRVVEIPVSDKALDLEPYSCPSCGESLYEKCEQCSRVRHALLPYCEHCGGLKMGSVDGDGHTAAGSGAGV